MGAEGQMVQQRQDLDAEEQEAREWSQMMVEEEVQRAVAVMRADAEQREKRSRQTVECMEDAVDEMAGRLTGLTRAVGNVYVPEQCAGRAGSARTAPDGAVMAAAGRQVGGGSGADEGGDGSSTRGDERSAGWAA